MQLVNEFVVKTCSRILSPQVAQMDFFEVRSFINITNFVINVKKIFCYFANS